MAKPATTSPVYCAARDRLRDSLRRQKGSDLEKGELIAVNSAAFEFYADYLDRCRANAPVPPELKPLLDLMPEGPLRKLALDLWTLEREHPLFARTMAERLRLERSATA